MCRKCEGRMGDIRRSIPTRLDLNCIGGGGLHRALVDSFLK